jgi:putative oxidoreductase
MNAVRIYRWLRLILGFVLLAAAPHKILNPEAFALTVARYDILPVWAVSPLALVLPWLEVVLGCLLVADVLMGPALWLTNGLFTAFAAALTLAMFRGLDVGCGCFSATTSSSMLFALVRDLTLLGLGIVMAIIYQRIYAPLRRHPMPEKISNEPNETHPDDALTAS